MRWLPNVLTLLRIVATLAFIACLIGDRMQLAALSYALGGLSDAIDGPMARHLGVASPVGARIDSLADTIFFTTAVAAVLLVTDLLRDPLVFIGIVLVCLLRGGNLLLTRLRFSTWNAMHTIGNKLAGLLVFVGILPVLLLDHAPRSLCLLLIGVAFLSAVEELVLIMHSTSYDPDAPGIGGRVLRAVRPTSG